MIFWKDIVFPIVLALLSIGLILFVVNLVFSFFRINIPLLKFIAVVAIWYFVGPIIYDWLEYHILTRTHEGIEIIYTPIQSFITAFKELM